MNMKVFINNGINIRKQRPGLPEDGPITGFLKSMSRPVSNGSSTIETDLINSRFEPISPVGMDVARLFAERHTRVVYIHTAGS
jgi:hypothetical protein